MSEIIPLVVPFTVSGNENVSFTIGATTEAGGGALPRVTAEDNDKIMQVKDGAWQVVMPDFGANFTTDETLTLANNVLSVNTTNDAAQDNTLPITSAGVNTIVGNINALLGTI